MNMLHRLLSTHFRKRRGDRNRMRYHNIWGRPAPGVTSESWDPAVAGLTLKER